MSRCSNFKQTNVTEINAIILILIKNKFPNRLRVNFVGIYVLNVSQYLLLVKK